VAGVTASQVSAAVQMAAQGALAAVHGLRLGPNLVSVGELTREESRTEENSLVTIERALRLIAGAFVILSVLLGTYVNANVLWFTLFLGANLFLSACTNWCPMMVVLRKGGLPDADHPRMPIVPVG
jgi:hypothetical protein